MHQASPPISDAPTGSGRAVSRVETQGRPVVRLRPAQPWRWLFMTKHSPPDGAVTEARVRTGRRP